MSVSSCTGSCLLGETDHEVGVADAHRGPVVEGSLVDAAALDEGAVGGAEVDDRHLGEPPGPRDPELRVPPADAGVVDAQVGLRPAADDEAGRGQRVGAAVDGQGDARTAYGGVGAL